MYPSQPLTLTWGGQIGSASNGSDIWQCGLHLGSLASTDTPVQPDEAELGTLYTTVIAPYHQRADTFISNGAILTWAKIVRSQTDGSYFSEPTVYNGAHAPGGSTAESGAPQLSMCITLWTGQALGKGNYGRYYLPWMAKAAEPQQGRISVTARDMILDSSLDFLNAVNTWGKAASAGDVEVLIYGSAGAGTKKRPTVVRVGDVVDTQRRRRNRIKEAYGSALLA